MTGHTDERSTVSAAPAPAPVPAATALPGSRPIASRTRPIVVSAALAAGALAAAVNMLARPLAAADTDRFSALQPVRDEVWTFALVGGVAAALAYIAAGIAVCMLVTGRGSAWATIGATLLTLGAVPFCAGFFAWGAVGWYATSDAAQGGALFAFAQDESAHMFAPQAVGFGLALLGIVALAVALWRSQAHPRPLALAVGLTPVIAVLSGEGIAYDVLYALSMLALAGVAWRLARPAPARHVASAT